jgi:predicted nucleotidyltransferase
MGNCIEKLLKKSIFKYKTLQNILMLKFHREILKNFEELKGKAKVIVYGSVAKGNYRLDSDIDVAVISKDKKVKKIAERIADKVYLKYGKIVSIKFLVPEDLKRRSAFIEEIKSGRRIV